MLHQLPRDAINELLHILGIVKQSLSRVLSKLIIEGIAQQEKGQQDKRLRLLSLTNKGTEFEIRISQNQRD